MFDDMGRKNLVRGARINVTQQALDEPRRDTAGAKRMMPPLEHLAAWLEQREGPRRSVDGNPGFRE